MPEVREHKATTQGTRAQAALRRAIADLVKGAPPLSDNQVAQLLRVFGGR